MKVPRLVRALLCASLGCILSSGALAAPYSVQISEVEMNNNGLYTDTTGTAVPAIFVRGTFSPTLPCAQQGFFLVGSDPLFQSTLAIILSAKASGALLGYTHVFCHPNGYSRGSTISSQ
jgi:hypothetical protein